MSALIRAFTVIAAIAVLPACSQVAAGTATDGSQAVQLGPLPTRPTTATPVAPSTTAPARPRPPATSTTTPSTTVEPTTSTTATTEMTSTIPTVVRAGSPKTSCTRLAYIGDSVSLGMVSNDASPDAPTALAQRVAAIGVAELRAEVSGGRSIVETLPGQENAVQVATRLRSEGFSGCWVIAVGTNDAANIAAGAGRQEVDRIQSLMAVIGTDPVLWLDAATVAEEGFWASSNMETWDAVLTSLVPSYPNLRIAAWSAVVQPQWYQPDGIHLLDEGSVARVEFVAASLIDAMPRR